MSASNTLELSLLDHLLGGGDYTPATNHYFAAFTAAPSDSGGGTEVTGGSYARVAMANNSTNWSTTFNGVKLNGIVIAFPTATANWGTVSHFGIFDSSTGGNLLWWGALTSPVTIASGDTASWDFGALQLVLSGAFGNGVRNGLLNLAFGATAFARPSTVYAELFTAGPAFNGGGTPVSGGSYARALISNDSSSFPSASGGTKLNGTQITFPTATANWGTVSHIGLFDSSTGGNLQVFCPLTVSRVINTGSTFKVAIGDLALSLD